MGVGVQALRNGKRRRFHDVRGCRPGALASRAGTTVNQKPHEQASRRPAAWWGLANLGCGLQPPAEKQEQAGSPHRRDPPIPCNNPMESCRGGAAQDRALRGLAKDLDKSKSLPSEQRKPARIKGACRGPAYSRARLIRCAITIHSAILSTPRQRRERQARPAKAFDQRTYPGPAPRATAPAASTAARSSPGSAGTAPAASNVARFALFWPSSARSSSGPAST